MKRATFRNLFLLAYRLSLKFCYMQRNPPFDVLSLFVGFKQDLL
jgi:hypothetical protein